MTVFDLTGFNDMDDDDRYAVGRNLNVALRGAGMWADSPTGLIVSRQIWPLYGAPGSSSYVWTNPSGVDIDTASLRRTDLSSLLRFLDSFARLYPYTHEIRKFVDTALAEDRVRNPTAARLFDA
ncbi:hypothetical protein [Streptomyces lavendulae]|uniref:hypothetical protein n=1 Tax=Streptomyces lavendulae TaxID=1914 RepID=UPI0033D46A78